MNFIMIITTIKNCNHECLKVHKCTKFNLETKMKYFFIKNNNLEILIDCEMFFFFFEFTTVNIS